MVKVLSVNGKIPLVDGKAISAQSGGGGSTVELDTTLTQSGKAADAKAVGDALTGKQDKLIAGENITIAADGKTISATGGGGGGSTVELDTTLSEAGKAADAKAVGDALTGKQDTLIQSGATVGQIAKITAVDASGVPTAWSPVDMPSGGEKWEKIAEIELRGDTAMYGLADFGVWRKAKVIMKRSKYVSGLDKNVWAKVVPENDAGYNCGYLTKSYGYVYWEFTAEVDELFITSSVLESNNVNTQSNIKSTCTLTPLDKSPSDYKFALIFTDTSVIQDGNKVTVIGVRR